MNPDFNRLLEASNDERLDLFLATAVRLGTPVQNVEKDFWVCWTLDALFNGLESSGPRLLFKGGTSLSKGYGLIERFSEDIDITVFRDDIDAATAVADLEALSRKRREKRLDDIRQACQSFIGGPLKTQLEGLAARVPIVADGLRVIPDTDGQTLLLEYPAVSDRDTYVRPSVKIEAIERPDWSLAERSSRFFAALSPAICQPQQHVAVTCQWRAPANQIPPAQPVELRHRARLLKQPALVLRYYLRSCAISADHERVAPYARPADVDRVLYCTR